jgi:hypothetical protein
MSDVTCILSQIVQVDPQAADRLPPQLYDELRKTGCRETGVGEAWTDAAGSALVHEA